MAKPCDFLMILVLMSYWSTCCLSCDLSQNDNFMNKTLFKLLVQKEQSSRLLCLEERKVFLCPLEKMDAQQLQKPQVIKVLYDVIQQSLMLFSSNESSAAWETTLREQFCDVLSLKLEDLQSCLMQQVRKDPVKKYFRKIIAYLREKKHSPCAWMVVRDEVCRAWSLSADLLKGLNKEEE
ncbi:interferon alpha-13-like [Chionomys nivalis]|uniref:interferon alpha-13-like n=1 Tax=Chionomys nivalis TaxID=269649 RepID=UPI002599426D|nr:interferon alpha-13-like [Chionomys nivalis]